MQLKNFMEDLVWQRLDEIIDGHKHVCSCEICRYDIVALALNSLPPRYIVTNQGEIFSRIKSLEHQLNIDIFTAISHAIQIVSNQPHHDAK